VSGIRCANVRLLERRLDNVVYRLGFARTRPIARQLVNQRHVRVNDRKVNIPSYLVRPGRKIALTEAAETIPIRTRTRTARPTPSWLQRGENGKGQVISLPSAADIHLPVDPPKVIAFYSR
jgi:small subunit ribosomal protein S4